MDLDELIRSLNRFQARSASGLQLGAARARRVGPGAAARTAGIGLGYGISALFAGGDPGA
jgi:hypothetical protein